MTHVHDHTADVQILADRIPRLINGGLARDTDQMADQILVLFETPFRAGMTLTALAKVAGGIHVHLAGPRARAKVAITPDADDRGAGATAARILAAAINSDSVAVAALVMSVVNAGDVAIADVGAQLLIFATEAVELHRALHGAPGSGEPT